MYVVPGCRDGGGASLSKIHLSFSNCAAIYYAPGQVLPVLLKACIVSLISLNQITGLFTYQPSLIEQQDYWLNKVRDGCYCNELSQVKIENTCSLVAVRPQSPPRQSAELFSSRTEDGLLLVVGKDGVL